MTRRAALTAPVKRAIFAGMALLGALALLPTGATYAMFSDSQSLQTPTFQTGSLSVRPIEGSPTVVATGSGQLSGTGDCTTGAAALQQSDHDLSEIVLGEADWACVTNTVEVLGSGQNLSARLTATLDPTGMPEGVTLRGGTITQLGGDDVAAAEFTQSDQSGLTADTDAFSADGSTIFAITYVIEHGGKQCASGTCTNTQSLPAIKVDVVQEAR